MLADVVGLRGENERGSRKKLIAVARWTIEYLPTCDGCRAMYAGRTPPGEPPCTTCRESPEEENEDALKIFFLVRNQLIMASNDPIDINHLAVHAAMDLYQVQNRRECFEKVINLAGYWIRELLARKD